MNQEISANSTEYKKSNQKLKIAIVRSNYYPDLTGSLAQSCKESLIAYGVRKNNITTFEVPGSWEIPLIVKKIATTKKFDGIAALGIIIKGETYHFELIANECARALMNISLEFNIPITFEILATYDLKQARQRTTGRHNKGTEAARTLIETINILQKIK